MVSQKASVEGSGEAAAGGAIAVASVGAVEFLVSVGDRAIEVFLQMAQPLAAEAEVAHAIGEFARQLRVALLGRADQFLGEAQMRVMA